MSFTTSGAPWTADELDKLKILYAEGLDPEEVARRLGRPIQGVQAKARYFDVAPRKQWFWKEDELASIESMHGRGLSDAEIAEQLGRSVRAVGWARRRYVGKSGSRKDIDGSRAYALYTPSGGWAGVADKMGRSLGGCYNAARRHADEAGLPWPPALGVQS